MFELRAADGECGRIEPRFWKPCTWRQRIADFWSAHAISRT
jgi:hypothetical protein